MIASHTHVHETRPHPHPHRHDHESVHDLFAARGLRSTRQRKAVFEALRSTTAHPTADDLFRMVSGRVNGLSLATVYNTLEALCNAGLAQKLPGNGTGGNGSARYDATVEDHLHLRDTRTGTVADVPHHLSKALLDRIPRDLLTDIEARLGFRIQHVQIELIGEKA